MPFSRKRKRKRRRSSKRGPSSNRLHSLVVRGPSAFPDKMFVRLKYSSSFAISTSALTSQIFSGNSVDEPDKALTSQRPRGYDQWMSIYGRYVVHKSSIRVQVLNLDPALTLDCVILPNDGVASFVDTEDAREQPYAKSRRISPLSGSNSAISMFNSMKTKTIMGQRTLQDLTYSAQQGFNPGQEWEWYVYLQNLVNDTGVVNCDISVSLTYYCEFFRRKFIPRSSDGLQRDLGPSHAHIDSVQP